jgi:hypothetical protein
LLVKWPPPFLHDFTQWSGDKEKGDTASDSDIRVDSRKDVVANFKPNDTFYATLLGVPIGIVALIATALRKTIRSKLKHTLPSVQQKEGSTSLTALEDYEARIKTRFGGILTNRAPPTKEGYEARIKAYFGGILTDIASAIKDIDNMTDYFFTSNADRINLKFELERFRNECEIWLREYSMQNKTITLEDQQYIMHQCNVILTDIDSLAKTDTSSSGDQIEQQLEGIRQKFGLLSLQVITVLDRYGNLEN